MIEKVKLAKRHPANTEKRTNENVRGGGGAESAPRSDRVKYGHFQMQHGSKAKSINQPPFPVKNFVKMFQA